MDFEYDIAHFIPFRDREACARARAITRAQLTEHPNPEFCISVQDDVQAFYQAFADDLVGRIRSARDEGRDLVAIVPVGPMPQYALAARAINEERLSLHHVHTFNMDEYADQDGRTAPASWAGSFARAMQERFFGLIDPELRPPDDQIHFPNTDNIGDYSKLIEDRGGADVCYGGIGWSGHIAFWEPQLGLDFAGDLDGYKAQGARIVELHPMTVMQNALHSFGGDWSWVPPKAATIGPRDVLGARHRSFWLDGDLGGSVSWQRFIARLVAHGPVNELVPGSLLQETRCDYTILGNVADDVEIHMA
jgi:glucosamine-6-phosphate deaminase